MLPNQIIASVKRDFRKETQVCEITHLVYDPGLQNDGVGYVYGNATDSDGFTFGVRCPIYHEEAAEQEFNHLANRLWRQCQDRFETDKVTLYFQHQPGFNVAFSMAQAGIVPTLAKVKKFQSRRLQALNSFDANWFQEEIERLSHDSE